MILTDLFYSDNSFNQSFDWIEYDIEYYIV